VTSEIIAPGTTAPLSTGLVLPNGASAQVGVRGNPFDTKPKRCVHDAAMSETTFGRQVDERTGETQAWAMRVKVICGTCGVILDVDPSSARLPRQGDHGVVFDLVPRVTEDEIH
jgi:hypothetical protein